MKPEPLATAGLEDAYDRIAEAIDAAGGHRELFLVKLALTLAWRSGDPAMLDEAIGIALRDLDPESASRAD